MRRPEANWRCPLRALPCASEHAYPLRCLHANGAGGSASEVKRNSARERATIVDDDCDRSPIFRIGNGYARSERQRSVRCRVAGGIEGLTACGSSSRNVVARDNILT